MCIRDSIQTEKVSSAESRGGFETVHPSDNVYSYAHGRAHIRHRRPFLGIPGDSQEELEHIGSNDALCPGRPGAHSNCRDDHSYANRYGPAIVSVLNKLRVFNTGGNRSWRGYGLEARTSPTIFGRSLHGVVAPRPARHGTRIARRRFAAWDLDREIVRIH